MQIVSIMCSDDIMSFYMFPAPVSYQVLKSFTTDAGAREERFLRLNEVEKGFFHITLVPYKY